MTKNTQIHGIKIFSQIIVYQFIFSKQNNAGKLYLYCQAWDVIVIPRTMTHFNPSQYPAIKNSWLLNEEKQLNDDSAHNEIFVLMISRCVNVTWTHWHCGWLIPKTNSYQEHAQRTHECGVDYVFKTVPHWLVVSSVNTGSFIVLGVFSCLPFRNYTDTSFTHTHTCPSNDCPCLEY